jgi:DNA-binding MarR family transcriptional regulator
MAKEFAGVWIPKAIYQDDKLTPTDKLILSDIYNLCAEGGDYFKTNETIAKEVNISIPSVSRTIKKLINLNYIKCEYNGRSRLIKMISTLIKLIKQPNQIDKAAISKRLDSIHSSIHTKKHISKERPFKSKEFGEIWDIWIDERKQQKRKKYTPRGEQATLHNLQKISNNNEKQAIKIIQQSITQGWQGLFALKGGAKRKQLNAEQALNWASGK